MKAPLLIVYFLVAVSALWGASDRKCVFRVEAVTEGGGLRLASEPYLGTSIVLYELPGGNIVGYRHVSWRRDDLQFGSGPEFTHRIRRAFSEAALHDFDFDKCVADAAQKRGFVGVFIQFATLRFFADLEGSKLSFTAEAVRAKVDEYSPYSDELSRLKVILDEIACELGRMEEVAKMPNQPPEPTAMSVTCRADARPAPAIAVAHL